MRLLIYTMMTFFLALGCQTSSEKLTVREPDSLVGPTFGPGTKGPRPKPAAPVNYICVNREDKLSFEFLQGSGTGKLGIQGKEFSTVCGDAGSASTQTARVLEKYDWRENNSSQICSGQTAKGTVIIGTTEAETGFTPTATATTVLLLPGKKELMSTLECSPKKEEWGNAAPLPTRHLANASAESDCSCLGTWEFSKSKNKYRWKQCERNGISRAILGSLKKESFSASVGDFEFEVGENINYRVLNSYDPKEFEFIESVQDPDDNNKIKGLKEKLSNPLVAVPTEKEMKSYGGLSPSALVEKNLIEGGAGKIIFVFPGDGTEKDKSKWSRIKFSCPAPQ